MALLRRIRLLKETMHIVIGRTQPHTRTKLAGLSVMLLGGQLVSAQQPSAPTFPAPPQRSEHAVRDPAFQHQYVFFDTAEDALVIRVPPDSEYVKSGKPSIIRYELHNRLAPTITSAISHEAGGYKYAYAVSNASSAKDSIRIWWLIIPGGNEQLKVNSPPTWGGATSVPAIMRQVELPEDPLGRSVMWIQDNPNKTISPGTSQD